MGGQPRGARPSRPASCSTSLRLTGRSVVNRRAGWDRRPQWIVFAGYKKCPSRDGMKFGAGSCQKRDMESGKRLPTGNRASAGKPRPTAIVVAANDQMAFGVIKGAKVLELAGSGRSGLSGI